MPNDQVRSTAYIAGFEDQAFALWETGVARAGGTVERESATDLCVMQGDASEVLSAYLTKAGDAISGAARDLTAEAALGQFKAERQNGNVAPFELLNRIRTAGDVDDVDLWAEWCRSTVGRKALTWSKSFRRLAGLSGGELTDEETVAEDPGTEDALLLPGETWRTIRDDVDRRGSLLEAMESSGREGAIALLEHWGLAWTVTCSSETSGPGRRRVVKYI